MTIQEIRAQFPALSCTVYGKPLVYFDNAATAQRPASVLQYQTRLASETNANIHRAVHKLAVDATQAFEQARDAVQAFLGAAHWWILQRGQIQDEQLGLPSYRQL